MRKLFHFSISIILFFIFTLPASSQSNALTQKKHTLELAHDRKIKLEEYTFTDEKLFQVKAYTVSPPKVNKSHHWFFKITSPNGEHINYAEVTLKGYFKNDPSIPFNYAGSIFKLCSEGKYVIGFVQVQQKGIWVLDFSIDNFGEEDTVSLEIVIN